MFTFSNTLLIIMMMTMSGTSQSHVKDNPGQRRELLVRKEKQRLRGVNIKRYKIGPQVGWDSWKRQVTWPTQKSYTTPHVSVFGDSFFNHKCHYRYDICAWNHFWRIVTRAIIWIRWYLRHWPPDSLVSCKPLISCLYQTAMSLSVSKARGWRRHS